MLLNYIIIVYFLISFVIVFELREYFAEHVIKNNTIPFLLAFICYVLIVPLAAFYIIFSGRIFKE